MEHATDKDIRFLNNLLILGWELMVQYRPSHERIAILPPTLYSAGSSPKADVLLTGQKIISNVKERVENLKANKQTKNRIIGVRIPYIDCAVREATEQYQATRAIENAHDRKVMLGRLTDQFRWSVNAEARLLEYEHMLANLPMGVDLPHLPSPVADDEMLFTHTCSLLDKLRVIPGFVNQRDQMSEMDRVLKTYMTDTSTSLVECDHCPTSGGCVGTCMRLL